MGDDEALLEVVTSANVACGFHAGDPVIMERTVRLAAAHKVAVGAHPGINDLWGFGRRGVEGTTPAEVGSMVAYQIGALQAIARRAGVAVTHVKLHGALSHAAVADPALADAVAVAIGDVAPEAVWLVPGGCGLAAVAERRGLDVRHEVFADRAYDERGLLLPRGQPGAVLEDPEEIAERAVRMVLQGGVPTVAGRWLSCPVDSICVHGDTPGAVAAAREVRRRLQAAGVRLAAMTAAG